MKWSYVARGDEVEFPARRPPYFSMTSSKWGRSLAAARGLAAGKDKMGRPVLAEPLCAP